MSDIIFRHEQEVLEGVDAWNVAAIAVPRATFSSPVLLTQSDVSGDITLNIYLPASSTVVYTTTFAKTSSQDGGTTQAIHPALVDSRWEGVDAIGHNFVHKIKQTDVGASTLKGGRKYTMVYSIPTAQDGNVYAIFVWNIHPRH